MIFDLHYKHMYFLKDNVLDLAAITAPPRLQSLHEVSQRLSLGTAELEE